MIIIKYTAAVVSLLLELSWSLVKMKLVSLNKEIVATPTSIPSGLCMSWSDHNWNILSTVGPDSWIVYIALLLSMQCFKVALTVKLVQLQIFWM